MCQSKISSFSSVFFQDVRSVKGCPTAYRFACPLTSLVIAVVFHGVLHMYSAWCMQLYSMYCNRISPCIPLVFLDVLRMYCMYCNCIPKRIATVFFSVLQPYCRDVFQLYCKSTEEIWQDTHYVRHSAKSC